MNKKLSDGLPADKSQAENFLTILDEGQEDFTFQTFDEQKKNKSLTCILHGSLDQHFDALAELNRKGAGIYITVNKTNLKGRKNGNIVRIRAVYCEDDGDVPGAKPLPEKPHVVVRTSPGKHHRYLITSTTNFDEYDGVIERMVQDHGSDPGAKGRARVLRLPGFHHTKDHDDIHMVRIVEQSGEQPFTWDKIKELFEPIEREPVRQVEGDRVDWPEMTIQEIQGALSFINADCPRVLWVNIGTALKGIDPNLVGEWVAWSRTSGNPKHKDTDDELRIQWNSFDPEKGAGCGTIVYHAKAAGWNADNLDGFQEIEADSLAEPDDNVEKGYPKRKAQNKGLNQMLKFLVFIQDENKVANLGRSPQNALMTMEAFRNMYRNFPKVLTGGRGRPMLATNAWLEDPARKWVRGCLYEPGKNRVFEAEGERWFNTFYMPNRGEPDGMEKTDIFLEYLKRIAPDDDDRELLLHWISCTVHRPEIRPGITPLLINMHHGSGRGWLVKLLAALLGAWNCTHTKMGTLAGQGTGGAYHDYLSDSTFCSIPEVRVGRGRFELDDEIRDQLTDSPLQLNKKYGKNGTFNIYANFLLASNHTDALAITAEDRRIFVITSYEAPMPEEYFTKTLYPLLDDGDFLDQVFWMLKEYGKPPFNPFMRAPMNLSKEMLVNQGKSELESSYDVMVMDPATPDVTLYKYIVRHLESNGFCYEEGKNKGELLAILRARGSQCNSGKKVNVEGLPQIIWAIRNLSKWTAAENSELRAELQRCELFQE